MRPWYGGGPIILGGDGGGGGGGGGAHGSGTLAARPASPTAGDTYEVTSGTGTGDRYECFVTGSWTLVSYSRTRLDETPYHWWRARDASGGAVDSGSGATNLAEAGGSTGLTYDARCAWGSAFAFSGASGNRYLRGAKDSGIALTGACTLSAWCRAATVSGTQTFFSLAVNLGANSQPYASVSLAIVSGQLRIWITTTGSSGSGQSAAGGTILPGVDHFLGLTWDGTMLTGWIDGVPVVTLTPTGGPNIYVSGANQRWVTGDFPGPFNERFTGRLGDLRVYTTAKDAAWWRETYARGIGAYEGA